MTLFFKKQSHSTSNKEIIKKLQSLVNTSLYLNAKIYYKSEKTSIDILLYHDIQGLFIIEQKAWTLKDFLGASLIEAQTQEKSKNTLAFQNTQKLIYKKLHKILNKTSLSITNYLFLENLTQKEYTQLNSTHKKLLPESKIIFKDSTMDAITQKFNIIETHSIKSFSSKNIIGNLCTQYMIYQKSNDFHIATAEQIAFLDAKTDKTLHLSGLHGSGKTSLLLLKAIIELLNMSVEKVYIIKQTLLASSIIQSQLLDILKYSQMDITLSSIEFHTPEKFIKIKLQSHSIIMCDDSEFLQSTFVNYLYTLEKKIKLIMVQNNNNNADFFLNKNFRIDKREVTFYKKDPYKKALQVIKTFINTKSDNILVLCNMLTQEKLKDDLDLFIDSSHKILRSDVALRNQIYTNISLATYKDITEVTPQHIIMLDIAFLSKNKIEYTFNLANKTVDILYEEECEEIRYLRKIYEDNKN